MPPPATIFFGWQSDTPANTNLSFIEKALKEAVKRLHADAELELAVREIELAVDRDTRDVPGSPPIAATILKKIDECAAFVGDLTLVGCSAPGVRKGRKAVRWFPNPNVGIEYGYALKARSHTGVIGVLNTAYGPARDHLGKLPFDLRHLRRPVTYRLAPGATAEEKRKAYDCLVTELVQRLRLNLQAPAGTRNLPVAKASSAPFLSATITHPGDFFRQAQDLIPEQPFGEGPLAVKIPNNAAACVRLYPEQMVPEFPSSKAAKEAASQGDLKPMGLKLGGRDWVRNAMGALAYAGPNDGNLTNFTQLFSSGEICGVDLRLVSRIHQNTVKGDVNFRLLNVYAFELSSALALGNFSKFMRETLKYPTPWRVEASLRGIKDSKLGLGLRNDGLALQDNVVWSKAFNGSESISEYLTPFFDSVWAAFGRDRPKEARDHLARNFGT